MNVFEMVYESWWSSDLSVTCNGTALARLRFGNWKTVGNISIDKDDYEVLREDIFSNRLYLELDGVQLCQTRIEGFWNQTASFNLEGVDYRLKWSALSSTAVLEKDGKEIGTVEPEELFSRGTRAAFLEDLSPLLSVFTLWLVAYKRRRDSSAAAG